MVDEPTTPRRDPPTKVFHEDPEGVAGYLVDKTAEVLRTLLLFPLADVTRETSRRSETDDAGQVTVYITEQTIIAPKFTLGDVAALLHSFMEIAPAGVSSQLNDRRAKQRP